MSKEKQQEMIDHLRKLNNESRKFIPVQDKAQLIKDHAKEIKRLLAEVNNHIDVIEQHGGKIEFWTNTDNRLAISKLYIEIKED